MLKIFSLVLLTLQLTSVVLARNALFNGDSLMKGEELVSLNGLYNLVMQEDGDLVIYNGDNEATWQTNTVDFGEQFRMDDDGNAVLYDSEDSNIWETGTGNRNGQVILMQNDGNLVVYTRVVNNNGGRRALWSSGTQGRNYNSPPDAINTENRSFKKSVSTHQDKDKLFPGEYLKKGEQLESENGKFVLVLRNDGFLALNEKGGNSLWNVGGGMGHVLKMGKEGNVVLYDAKNNVLWQTNTMGAAALVLRSDGNLVVLAKDQSVVWQSGTTQVSKSNRGGMPGMWKKTTTTTTTTTEATTTEEPKLADDKPADWFDKNWNDGNIALVLQIAVDGLDVATKNLFMAHVKSNEKLADAYSQNKFVYNRSWEDLIKRIAGNVKPTLSWN